MKMDGPGGTFLQAVVLELETRAGGVVSRKFCESTLDGREEAAEEEARHPGEMGEFRSLRRMNNREYSDLIEWGFSCLLPVHSSAWYARRPSLCSSQIHLWYFPSLTIPSSLDHFLLSPFMISSCFDSHFPPVLLTLSPSWRFYCFPFVFISSTRVLLPCVQWFPQRYVPTYLFWLLSPDWHVFKACDLSQNIIATVTLLSRPPLLREV